MRLKNSRLLGEFFSFHANARSLIFFFWLERACQDVGRHRAPSKLVTFLSVKGEYKAHDSKNALKTAVELSKHLYIQ